MKKLLTILTGIVFLTAILSVGGCKSPDPAGPIKDSSKVIIYLKIIEIDGEKLFSMYDSNNPANVVDDTLREGEVTFINLYTDVLPEMKVIWKLDRRSGIKKIKKIISAKGDRNIFKEDAKKRFLRKEFKLELRDDITGPDEKYIIEFVDKDEKKLWPIDPFLRIP